MITRSIYILWPARMAYNYSIIAIASWIDIRSNIEDHACTKVCMHLWWKYRQYVYRSINYYQAVYTMIELHADIVAEELLSISNAMPIFATNIYIYIPPTQLVSGMHDSD